MKLNPTREAQEKFGWIYPTHTPSMVTLYPDELKPRKGSQAHKCLMNRRRIVRRKGSRGRRRDE